ncbi:MAG: hypothetical protein M1839_003521 [Geoglossum umbratile]|nr:MAG: hypothetical protein M1839_003521 [Geoglossum umbratile]
METNRTTTHTTWVRVIAVFKADDGEHVERQRPQQEPRRDSWRGYRIAWAVIGLLIGIVLSMSSAVGCASTPTNNLHLYSLRPVDVGAHLARMTGGVASNFQSSHLPTEWRVGFSGVCAVSPSASHCSYKFGAAMDLQHLASAALQGKDTAVLDRWKGALAKVQNRHDATKSKQMAGAAAAFLIFALLLYLPVAVVPAFDNGSTTYNVVCIPIFVVHGFLLGAAALLQMGAAHAATRFLTHPEGTDYPYSYGQGYAMVWAAAALTWVAIPVIMVIVFVTVAAALACIFGMCSDD